LNETGQRAREARKSGKRRKRGRLSAKLNKPRQKSRPKAKKTDGSALTRKRCRTHDRCVSRGQRARYRAASDSLSVSVEKRTNSSRRLSGMIARVASAASSEAHGGRAGAPNYCPWYHGAPSKRRVDTWQITNSILVKV
jgi:hypothetical protein